MKRLPAAAQRAYNRLKDSSDFIKLTNRIINKLLKITNTSKRALEVFKEVDLRVAPVINDPAIKDKISCKKGCSACCHTLVGITSDEAHLYARKISNGEVKIDIELLGLQANIVENPHAWYYLPFKQRRCVFLSLEGTCQIYDDRPILCRTNYVVSPPEFCSTQNGIEQPVALLNLDEANMVVIGAYQMSDRNGELPKMLWEALSEKIKSKVELKDGLKSNLLRQGSFDYFV